MRELPRIGTLLTAVVLVAVFTSTGCSSRKQVPSAEIEPPPPPPPTETMREEPPPPPREEPKPQMSLQDAFFDFDESTLRSDAKAALENNGRYLKQDPEAKIIIEGHCDERGSVEYNLALGERRARAAKDFLVSFGIQSGRITTISYGKERPFSTGHDEDSWSKNRRAHFVTR